jgi:Domain of unknown function (DUF397)
MQHDLTSADWHKSSYSGNSGNCIEMAELPGVVAVRDSKNPDDGALGFTPETWTAFTIAIKAGQLG